MQLDRIRWPIHPQQPPFDTESGFIIWFTDGSMVQTPHGRQRRHTDAYTTKEEQLVNGLEQRTRSKRGFGVAEHSSPHTLEVN